MSISENRIIIDIPLSRNSRELWEGEISLSAWAGYGNSLEACSLSAHQKQPTGPLALIVEPIEQSFWRQQAEALQHFLTNQQSIQAQMLRAIWRVVIECDKDAYDDVIEADDDLGWDAVTQKANNPTETDLQRLRSLMAPATLNVFPGNHHIPVQLSLTFECAWDPDHGLEVLVEQGEIKEIDAIGGLETCAWDASFLRKAT